MAESDGMRALPALWQRCLTHNVLVKIRTRCSACAGDGQGKSLSLRGEHFEVGEPQPGWRMEVEASK